MAEERAGAMEAQLQDSRYRGLVSRARDVLARWGREAGWRALHGWRENLAMDLMVSPSQERSCFFPLRVWRGGGLHPLVNSGMAGWRQSSRSWRA
jgi:hypothetical protein